MPKDLIRLMHALFMPGAEACREAPWQPLMDVYRTPTGWLVKFDLAGVRAEDIELEVLGGNLRVSGVRRDRVLEEAQKNQQPLPVHYRMEIAYSRFDRRVELPCDLKRAVVETEYRDGLLLVHIKPEQKEDNQ